MLQRQFSQLKTKHFRYPIFFSPPFGESSVKRLHTTTHIKLKIGFWLDKRKRMFLSASGTKKSIFDLG